MFPSAGSGYNSTNQKRYQQRKRRLMYISSTKRLSRQGLNIFGFDGLLLSQKIEKSLIGISISKERNMFVAEGFLSNLVEKYGQYPFVENTINF